MTIKNFLKTTALYRYIVSQRTKQAERFLAYANLFPESRAAVLADYGFSIQRSYRGIMQVVNLEECIGHVTSRGILGAFVETGVFTGGASAYALRCLIRHQQQDRAYWGFDSFAGMPKPTKEDGYHATAWLGTDDQSGALQGCAVNLSDYDQTKAYLCSSGYPMERINLVKGWFQDTLPKSKAQIGLIAILRLDGDFYESTKVVLEQLFDQVAPGGIVIVDDYGSFEGCRRAVDEFLSKRGLSPFIHYVENGVRFFVKP